MSKRVGGFINQDGLNAPDAPTSVSGTAGDEQVDVSFTAPSDVGGAAVSGYRVTDTTGAHGASGSASPITVTGLTNDTAYTFRVWAINSFGWSSPSDASGSVTPAFIPTAWFAGGGSNIIDFVAIATTGNATDWGDLQSSVSNTAGCSSATRGLVQRNYTGNVDYITFATQGNSVSFGNLSSARDAMGL
jgi:hypothetical protein